VRVVAFAGVEKLGFHGDLLVDDSHKEIMNARNTEEER
jgi:hypothetical protein